MSLSLLRVCVLRLFSNNSLADGRSGGYANTRGKGCLGITTCIMGWSDAARDIVKKRVDDVARHVVLSRGCPSDEYIKRQVGTWRPATAAQPPSTYTHTRLFSRIIQRDI